MGVSDTLSRLPPHTKYVLLMLCSFFTAYTIMILRRHGYFEKIETTTLKSNQVCNVIDNTDIGGVNGLLQSGNLVFGTSSSARNIFSSLENAKFAAELRNRTLDQSDYKSRFDLLNITDRGYLFYFDIEKLPTIVPKKLELLNWDWKVEPDFYPLGLDITEHTDKTKRLDVVYTTRNSTKVAQFKLVSHENGDIQGLEVISTLFNPLFTNLRNIKYVDDFTFYATNKFLSNIDDEEGMAKEVRHLKNYGSLLKCSSQKPEEDVYSVKNLGYRELTQITNSTSSDGVDFYCYKAIDTLGEPTGLAISKAKNLLFLSTYSQRHVYGYNLDTLHRLYEVEAGLGLDNIYITSDNDLWVSVHQSPYKYAEAMRLQTTEKAPSKLVKLYLASPAKHKHLTTLSNAQTIYADANPEHIGALAVVVPIQGKQNYFVAASSIDKGLLVCTFE